MAEPIETLTTATSSPGDVRGSAVEFESVSKLYMTRGAASVAALSDVSFRVEPGEVYGIIGRSGAGKSTLIRLINGLETPTAGRVQVDGIDVGALANKDLPALRRRIGMIFQGFNLLSAKTVEDNVALPLVMAGGSWKDSRKRAHELLEIVGLNDKRTVYPARLSGGQKQRVGIARALILDPRVLLSDEATSALDPETTRSILALLRDINKRLGLTIVLITHEMEVIRQIADRVAVIEAGRIVETGPVWKVFGSPRNAATRSILAPANGRRPADIVVEPGRSLIEIDYTGAEGHDPDLYLLASVLGPDARLVYGGIDRIQGRAQGRLVFSVPEASESERELLTRRLRKIAGKSEPD